MEMIVISMKPFVNFQETCFEYYYASFCIFQDEILLVLLQTLIAHVNDT